jgi:hypothetical protein
LPAHPLIKGIIEVMRRAWPDYLRYCVWYWWFSFKSLQLYYITNNYHLDKKQKNSSSKCNRFKGKKIVDAVYRHSVMNMNLHGIGGEDSPVAVGH